MLPEPLYERYFDVVVIGAGLSGLFAATLLSKTSLGVAVVARGVGAVVASTGFVDVLKQTPDGKAVEDLSRAFAKMQSQFPEHPYTKIGWHKLIAAEDYLIKLLASSGLNYHRPCQSTSIQAVTALGLLKPTHLLPTAAATLETLRDKKVAVLSLKGYSDFDAGLVQGHLSVLLPGTKISRATVSLPWKNGQYLSGNLKGPAIARWLDDEEEREKFLKNLKEGLSRQEVPRVVLLPAVLGLRYHSAFWIMIREVLGIEVLEVPTLPPSVPGLRLFNALKAHLDSWRVHLNLNGNVIRGSATAGRIDYVDIASEGKIIRYRARYFILATGGIYGGGLIENNGKVYEPLFNSPLLGECSLNFREFPFDTGVAVDKDLRVHGFSNLLACGRILGGHNPYNEGSGNGIALATAFKAVETLKGEAAG